jgi:hypothetical protein
VPEQKKQQDPNESNDPVIFTGLGFFGVRCAALR